MPFQGKLHTLRSKVFAAFDILVAWGFSLLLKAEDFMCVISLLSSRSLLSLSFTLDISSLIAHCLQLRNSLGYSGFRALSWTVDL